MHDRISTRISLFANVATIVVVIAIAVVLAKRFVLTASTTGPAYTDVAVGTRIDLPNIDWSKANKHLLLVLQKGCHFCSESSSFYQRLVHETSGRDDLKLIAVLPQRVDEARQYLDDIGVFVNDIRQVPPSSLGVHGTPTLLLVNGSGEITDAWAGKLSTAKENEVERSLALK